MSAITWLPFSYLDRATFNCTSRTRTYCHTSQSFSKYIVAFKQCLINSLTRQYNKLCKRSILAFVRTEQLVIPSFIVTFLGRTIPVPLGYWFNRPRGNFSRS